MSWRYRALEGHILIGDLLSPHWQAGAQRAFKLRRSWAVGSFQMRIWGGYWDLSDFSTRPSSRFALIGAARLRGSCAETSGHVHLPSSLAAHPGDGFSFCASSECGKPESSSTSINIFCGTGTAVSFSSGISCDNWQFFFSKLPTCTTSPASQLRCRTLDNGLAPAEAKVSDV